MSHNIDKIIYINLEKRQDRKCEIENELNRMGLKKYERFNAIEKDLGPLGCCISHLEVLKLAKRNNYKNVLIMEDDFIFIVDKHTLEDRLNNFFCLEIPYDVCMLSYYIIQSEETRYGGIRRVKEATTASGYIVNNHYFDKLINLLETARDNLEKTGQHWIYTNDRAWKNLQETDNWFYLEPRIGKQREGYSDNAKCYIQGNEY